MILEFSLVGAVLIAITVAIHAVGTVAWFNVLARRIAYVGDRLSFRHMLGILSSTVIVLIALHAVQIVIWAAAYRMLLPAGELADFEAAIYFSFVTFTTLGYGDITLSEGWRLLSGIEALNGLLLVGWTTALLFAIVQKVWLSIERRQTD